MNVIKSIFIVVLIVFTASCNSKENTIQNATLTVGKARMIAKEYNLPEDMVIFPEETNLSQELGGTEKELREILSFMEEYTGSKGGRISWRVGKFYEKYKNPTKAQEDSLFQAIDKEFGTNYYNEDKAFEELKTVMETVEDSNERYALIKKIDEKYKTNFYNENKAAEELNKVILTVKDEKQKEALIKKIDEKYKTNIYEGYTSSKQVKYE